MDSDLVITMEQLYGYLYVQPKYPVFDDVLGVGDVKVANVAAMGAAKP